MHIKSCRVHRDPFKLNTRSVIANKTMTFVCYLMHRVHTHIQLVVGWQHCVDHAYVHEKVTDTCYEFKELMAKKMMCLGRTCERR